MDAFNAFSEAQSASFGDLTVESDEAQLAIYGRMALVPDAASLARLDHLIAVLSQARAGLVGAMGAPDPDPDLDPAPPSPKALPSVRNPFA